jgi:hypothetical protein
MPSEVPISPARVEAAGSFASAMAARDAVHTTSPSTLQRPDDWRSGSLGALRPLPRSTRSVMRGRFSVLARIAGDTEPWMSRHSPGASQVVGLRRSRRRVRIAARRRRRQWLHTLPYEIERDRTTPDDAGRSLVRRSGCDGDTAAIVRVQQIRIAPGEGPTTGDEPPDSGSVASVPIPAQMSYIHTDAPSAGARKWRSQGKS